MSLTYVVRESNVHSNVPTLGSFVSIFSESSGHLRSINSYSYYANYNRTTGPSFVVRLKESVFWIHQSEEQVLVSTETVVFLMLALLAINHAVGLIASFVRKTYHVYKMVRNKLNKCRKEHSDKGELDDFLQFSRGHFSSLEGESLLLNSQDGFEESSVEDFSRLKLSSKRVNS